MTDRLHIAIIGSGGGAFAAAIRATEAGARVTMIESGALGGTCVNVGCVPSKILLRAGEIAHCRGHHPFEGIPREAHAVDRGALQHQLEARVEALRLSKYRKLIEDNPAITLRPGRARFEDASTVCVEDEDGRVERLYPDRILIATGASPLIPAIGGLERTPYWTSADALFSHDDPGRLAVIGSSFVALEIAQAYRRLGSEVTVIARHTLLGKEDPDIGASLRSVFEAEGIRVLDHAEPRYVAYRNGQFLIEAGAQAINSDRLLIATGRRPNTGALNLPAADVEMRPGGAVRVNDRLQTSAPHIYAVGDCTDMPQLVYVAAAAGTHAAVNMTGGDAPLDLSVVPTVLFTDPQVATVGLDRRQAEAAGIAIESRRLDLEHVPRAIANFETRGFIRLVAEARTGRLIGAQIVAPNAGEVVQTAAMAIRENLTVHHLATAFFPYLTMVEGLKLCAQAFTRDITKLSCCAG